ncbi:hypothetical protein [Blastococcus sp. LR1]|uniref:hypothetical protein n=1 Tax=Blastococcus sp. LR1 TaxID=2877000 RepID=UPI001CCB4546|nr:hypothetical protein [Blastococcus sp. LR1]MCA0143394.1 hypothetical protein [Blastococcus sp. LR1]
MHIRLGRLVLRTYRSYVMWLPSGYKEPSIVYLVETHDEEEGRSYQLGGFTTEREAQACIRKLESEGWTGLDTNIVTVHERLTDWQWNR